MGFASHLGPWLLGTVKNTTGTTAGTVRNMGATTVAQVDPVSYTDAAASVACVLPAGAIVTGVQFITTTTFTAASTIVVSVNGVAVNTAATITTGGSYPITTLNTQAVGRELVVGTSDVFVTYTLSVGASSAGAGVLVTEYIVLGSDGASNPSQA